ncbi:MAG TPA: serine hydrolase [Candidatus Paceibacterota bacterium]
MRRNSNTWQNGKLLLLAFAISIPFWWGINLFSETISTMSLGWQLRTNPEILQAYAAQEALNQKLQQAYPLRQKGSTALQVNARAAQSTLVKPDGAAKALFEQNQETPTLIASLTKLMTAFVAMERYSADQQVTITPEIVFVEGNSGQLRQWQVFTIRDLLYIALIESSNDAATALTQPAGYDAFIEAMNAKAANLDMQTALFANPTGLDTLGGNYASASDLTKLAIHLKNTYPQIFDILSQQQFPIRMANGKFHHTLINTNQLLGYKEWPAKILGGKTGWTPAAKQSLLLVAESPDKQGYIVNVILGSDDRFGEMKKLLAWNLASYQWNLEQ